MIEPDGRDRLVHSAISGKMKKISRTSTTFAAIIRIDAVTTLRVAA